jgi:hypothetical protein
MGALGAALLWQWGHPSVLFFGVLLLIVAVSGAAWLLLGAWFERHRPDPTLATAPSGAAATFFPRSRFVIVMGVLLSSALGGWLLAVAAAAYLGGHPGWALVALVLALASFSPVAVAAAGKIRAGGLWLTRSGIEYRNEATSWSVPWSGVRHVVAEEPVRLRLEHGSAPAVRRSVRWIWNREPVAPEGSVGIDTSFLAGGAPRVLAVLAHYLDDPPRREQLGTPDSLTAVRAAPPEPPSAT